MPSPLPRLNDTIKYMYKYANTHENKKKIENISDWENVSGMPKTETDVVDARRCTEKPIKKKNEICTHA